LGEKRSFDLPFRSVEEALVMYNQKAYFRFNPIVSCVVQNPVSIRSGKKASFFMISTQRRLCAPPLGKIEDSTWRRPIGV